MIEHCYIHDGVHSKVTPFEVGLEECAPLHSYGPGVRMYWLIHYVVSGTGKYAVRGKEYDVLPGQAFLIRPGEISKYTADKNDPWFYIWIGFDADIPALYDLPYIIDDDNVRAVFRSIHQERFHSNDQAYAIAKTWLLVSSLIGLTGLDLGGETDSYVAHAISYIKRQYMLDISVKSIADQLSLDRSYFSHLFKQHTGLSPGQYIIRYRLKEALSLLRCEKYSISVIAASVGYKDVFTFSRSFKKHFGVPPQRFNEIRGTNAAYVLNEINIQ